MDDVDRVIQAWLAIDFESPNPLFPTDPDLLVGVGVVTYEEHQALQEEIIEAAGGADRERLERLGLL